MQSETLVVDDVAVHTRARDLKNVGTRRGTNLREASASGEREGEGKGQNHLDDERCEAFARANEEHAKADGKEKDCET